MIKKNTRRERGEKDKLSETERGRGVKTERHKKIGGTESVIGLAVDGVFGGLC